MKAKLSVHHVRLMRPHMICIICCVDATQYRDTYCIDYGRVLITEPHALAGDGEPRLHLGEFALASHGRYLRASVIGLVEQMACVALHLYMIIQSSFTDSEYMA